MNNMFKSYKLQLSALLLVAMTLTGGSLALAQDETPIPDPGSVAATTDTAYPADVENVVAVPGDQSITLSWDQATDNVGVTGYEIFYGTSSVSTDSASYTMGPIDVGNVLTYDVMDLENDQPYYFAITAYDAAGNKSEFYSLEATATPAADSAAPSADDTVAPTVVKASAPYKNQVQVVFSEAVELPNKAPQGAFTAKDDFLGTSLEISKAEMDSSDASNKTVLLTTAEQKKSAKYILTVGIQVKDLAGNPIVSGTSDTASFTASTLTKPVEEVKPAAEETPADTVAPTLTGVTALDATTMEVTFSEPVVLLTNAAENFIITDFADNTKITNVTKVSIGDNGTKATLTTEPLEAKKYNLILIKVKDLAGNTMLVENSATTFDGLEVAPVDEPPVDDPTDKMVEEAASNLVAKAMANMMANLSWNTKEDKMAQVANFVLYMSTDRGTTYGDGIVLAKDIKSYNFENLKSDMVYYFKLTTKDTDGMESEGLVTYMTLPATGPELALLLFLSGGAGAFFTRKKKK